VRRARIIALSILLGLATTPVAAATVARTALSYEQNEDRSNFINQVRKARKGDTEAQWQVGSTYVHLGDPVRALSMLQAAATVGHPRAAALLGWLHEEGRGTAKSIDEARRWYLVAAEYGQADAMAALGRLSLQESAPEAQDSAWQWFEKAARFDHPVAQYHLGWILAQRTGAGRDDAGAYGWFLKAATQGHVGAQVAVATHLLFGRGVARDSKAADKWLQHAAEKQDPVANFLLGRLNEDSGPAGLDKARASFRVAAAAGHREAQFVLATLLAKSVVEADRKEAAEWFAKAQEAGHKAAANCLGELYRDGAGDLQQLVLARSIFRRAAEQGDANAMYNLAQLQNQGLGGPRDIGEALEWYTRAAEEGHEKASEVLASLLNSSVKTTVFGLKGFWQ
jgi:TPR repeat protein